MTVDFHPLPLSRTLSLPAVYPVANDAEVHVLSAAAVQHGYKEDFEALGISESKEVELSLAHRRELWEGSRWESFHQTTSQQLHDACDAQSEARRSGREYDVALGDDDISTEPSSQSAAIPQLPREFWPPPGLGEVAVRAAHVRLRALQSRWPLQPQRRWFQELARNTPLPRLAESMFPAHPADPVNLAWLAEFQVPPLRAAWYIRIHTIHRGEWHKAEDKALLRSKLWTGDLLRALDELLDSALPYSSPGSSPPPQPTTPPQPDDDGGNSMDRLPVVSADSFDWCPATDRSWVVPCLAAAIPPETASKWHYHLCLLGHTYREALVDAEALVVWLLQHLGRTRRSPAVMACLLPVLQLCTQELLLSQLHVRHLLDLCCRHLSAYGPAHSASVHLTVEGKVAAGVTLALRYVILHSPQSLVALDLKPIQAALDITTNIEDHTGAGLTAAAATSAISGILLEAAVLGSAVNVRVLAYDEAAAVQVLEDALRVSGAAQALRALHERMDRSVPSAEFPSIVVRLACNWACAPGVPTIHRTGDIGDAGDGNKLSWHLPLRRLFVTDIMRQLAAHLREQRDRKASAQPPALSPEPLLQETVLEWLGAQRVASVQCAAAELVVDLSTAGLFCPAQFLDALLARGLLEDRNSIQGSTAAQYRAFLRHVHPQLHLPTLMPSPTAKTATPASQQRTARPLMSAPSREAATGSLSANLALRMETELVAPAAVAAPAPLHRSTSKAFSEQSEAGDDVASAAAGQARRQNKFLEGSGSERWSAARVVYAQNRSMALRGIDGGIKRERVSTGSPHRFGRFCSEEATSGCPDGQGESFSVVEAPLDQRQDPWLEWANRASAEPAAKRVKYVQHSGVEKSPSMEESAEARAATAPALSGSMSDQVTDVRWRDSSRSGASRQETYSGGTRRIGLRKVQKLVTAALPTYPPSDTPAIPDDSVVDAIMQLRPWERRCLARWLANEMRVAVIWNGKISSNGNRYRGDGWVLRGLALIEAAGGLTEAAALLVLLITRMLRQRKLALPVPDSAAGSPVGADRMWQETGVSERCVLTALAVRAPNFAAMGCLAKVLSAATAWAFAKAGALLPREQGLLHFGEAVDFAGAWLCAYRSNPGVVQWWGTLQKTHPQHWLTTLLAARLTPATAESDTSSVVTLLPVTCQIETNPPPVGAEQRQAQLEATCANLLTFPDAEDAGRLLVQFVERGTLANPNADTEPPGLQAVCKALLISYLRILPVPQHGGGGTAMAAQREVHMQCLGHICYLLRRKAHHNISSWVQRCLCSLLSTTQVADGTQAENAAIFAAQCVVRGFVDMRCLLSHCCALQAALGSSLLNKLLMSKCTDSATGLCCGVELEVRALDVHQAQLLLQTLWSALGEHVMVAAESGKQQQVPLEEILQHAPVRAVLLSNPRQLLEKLASLPVRNPDIYSPLVAAITILTGKIGKDASLSLEYNEACAGRVLQQLTADNAAVSWLLLRCLLNEQVMMAARKRMDVRKAREVANRAFAEADAGVARTSEAEKTFTSQVLATVLERPGKGALMARLTWALGRGIGEYLLQQADWVLQDSSSLLGKMSLANVLRKRCGSSAQADSASHPPEDDAVQAGFADLALTGLALSDQVRQHDFAQQIVHQLQKLGDVLRVAKQGEDAKVGASTSSGLASKASSEADRGAALRPKGFGGGFGVGKARRLSVQGEAHGQSAGSVEGVRAAVALRLQILLPLLPIVYADRETDRSKNLRYQLARALLPILASPFMHASLGDDNTGTEHAAIEHDPQIFQQLLSVLHAMLAPDWATWLRGSQGNLREVPAFEDAASLQMDIEPLAPPARVGKALHSAMHMLPAPVLALPQATPLLVADPAAALAPEGTSASEEGREGQIATKHEASGADPWFLDGAFSDLGGGKAPRWLKGAVRRRPGLTGTWHLRIAP